MVNPTFNNVTTVSDEAATVSGTKVSFVGIYAPTALEANTTANLYLGNGNTLYCPTTEGVKVNAFCAYFTADLGTSAVRSFNLNFGDDTQGIDSIYLTESANGAWFSLDGKKLSSKPTA